MSTLAVELHPQAQNITCTDAAIIVELLDGRTMSAPLVWFPRLSQATKEQLDNWELLGERCWFVNRYALNPICNPSICYEVIGVNWGQSKIVNWGQSKIISKRV
jgi:hypothetical protein